MRCFAFLLALSLTACTQFPELDKAVTAEGAGADYPDLLPVEPVLAQAASGPAPGEVTDSLSARVSALRARASRLRGSVLDGSTRQRMRDGIAQG